jgi:hypothetical protein
VRSFVEELHLFIQDLSDNIFLRGHFVMVEITQKMEGATALLGGMAVLGALSLIVIFALHSIVGTTEFTLVTSPFLWGWLRTSVSTCHSLEYAYGGYFKFLTIYGHQGFNEVAR